MLNRRKKFWWGVGVAIGLGILISWPALYATVAIEPDVDLHHITPLAAGDTYEQDLVIHEGNLATLVLWLSPHESIARPDTRLEVQIIDPVSRDLLRTDQQPVPALTEPKHARIAFSFWPLWNNRERTVRLVLRATEKVSIANVHPDMVEAGAGDIALQQYKRVPLVVAVWLSLTSHDIHEEDIYQHWRRGHELLEGVNPYACILDATCQNSKYPIHLPFFYELSALSQKMGLSDFETWVAWWRPFFAACYLLIGGLLFSVLWARQRFVLAIFALLFWLGNRWSLYVLTVAHIDFLGLFWLVLSIVLWNNSTAHNERRQVLASFFLGLSLAVKHVAAPLIPLYLIHSWRSSIGRSVPQRVQYVVWHLVAMMAVPFISFLYFMWDTPTAFLRGVFFSLVRDSQSDFGAPAFSAVVGWGGGAAAAVILLLWGVIYIGYWRRPLPLSVAALAVLVTFVAFNRVIFNQYFVWLMPFIPLALAETSRGFWVSPRPGDRKTSDSNK